MQWFALSLMVLAIFFGGVLLWGAPYLPTLRKQTDEALDMLDLKPGQRLLELGCGDGRVMVAALDRGLVVTGYELNPLLFAIAWLRTRKYRGRAQVILGNYWLAQWPPADGIFVFLLERYMKKMDKKITHYNWRPVKLVSYAFKMPDRKPTKQKAALYLYTYA